MARSPRILLFTGKGGVGKTCSAAATAAVVAESGKRVLVMSTDLAHSLSDAFALPLGAAPTPITGNLFGLEIDIRHEVHRHWSALQQYFTELLQARRYDEMTAHELAYFPGIEELLSLMKIQEHAHAFDVVVVDCAPTAGTLRILTFPSVWANFFSKLFSLNRGVLMRTIGAPVLKSMSNVRLPSEATSTGFERLLEHTRDIGKLLTDPDKTSVRLVVNPERMVVQESYRTFMYLNLFEYSVDGLIVNRLLPPPPRGRDDYFAKWRKTQEASIEEIKNNFYPLTMFWVKMRKHSLNGVEEIVQFGREIYGDTAPDAVLLRRKPITYFYDPDRKQYEISIAVPQVSPEQVRAERVGDELAVTIGPYKRVLALPVVLQSKRLAGARVTKGALEVVFDE